MGGRPRLTSSTELDCSSCRELEKAWSVPFFLLFPYQAFDAAQARYAKGVTGILEVITTQTALANAQQQQISALAGWQNARIQLASSLGSLDVRSLSPTP
ncbi:TolC family protein [Pseudomonas sp. 6D_7.1_Bac1]|uniref:TolC family protein n=1 Tax=Pseudomonas sp. 6D_7.1_Bac1 TaxID=2971615 RepID=UPI003965D474